MSMKYPNILKQTRQGLGLSADYVAEVLGVTLVTVRNWERGATRPSAKDSLALSKMYEKAQEDLFLMK